MKRYIAKNIVAAGLAKNAVRGLRHGVADPLSVNVDTYANWKRQRSRKMSVRQPAPPPK